MAAKKMGEARGKGKAVKPGDKGKKGVKGKRGKGRKGMGNKAAKRRMELQAKGLAGKLTAEERTELEALWKRRLERANRPGPHRERYLELLEKEKEGKLTDDEKKALDQLNRIRQRHRRLMKRDAKRDKSRKDRVRRARRKLLDRNPDLQKNDQARAELRKHAMREAMLERARDVARAEGMAKLVARAEKLLKLENARHDKWMATHLSKAKQGDKK